MIQSVFARYRHNTIYELADRFSKEYYAVVEAVMDNIASCLIKLQNLSIPMDFIQYLDRCNELVLQVGDHLAYRKDVLLPYMADLGEKSNTGHDCTNCSGGCHIGHNARLAELNISHRQVKNTLELLKFVAAPDTAGLVGRELGELQEELLQLDATLTELYYLEQEVLIPKLVEAQKRINAKG